MGNDTLAEIRRARKCQEKKAFCSEAEAREFQKGRHQQDVYHCDLCNFWHLTTGGKGRWDKLFHEVPIWKQATSEKSRRTRIYERRRNRKGRRAGSFQSKGENHANRPPAVDPDDDAWMFP